MSVAFPLSASSRACAAPRVFPREPKSLLQAHHNRSQYVEKQQTFECNGPVKQVAAYRHDVTSIVQLCHQSLTVSPRHRLLLLVLEEMEEREATEQISIKGGG